LVPHSHGGQAKPAARISRDLRETTINAPTAATPPAGLTPRTALVGGAATGIGYAIAERLAPTHRVVITGRRAGPLEEAAIRIKATTGAAVGTVVGDIADPEAEPSTLGAASAYQGPPDVLILNAGGPPPGRILDITDDGWRAGAELLLLGPLRLAREVLPGMAARGFGRLIFITSTAVRQPQPDLATSVVLRAAVTAAAKLLSAEYAKDGVTVNCVAPGATDTQRRRDILAARAAATGIPLSELEQQDASQVPAGRAADPAEIAAAVAFLVSAEAGYVNGTVLTVDGGRTETI
jgi:3-oxoacyl-[acyl-carrier protein] reductase